MRKDNTAAKRKTEIQKEISTLTKEYNKKVESYQDTLTKRNRIVEKIDEQYGKLTETTFKMEVAQNQGALNNIKKKLRNSQAELKQAKKHINGLNREYNQL